MKGKIALCFFCFVIFFTLTAIPTFAKEDAGTGALTAVVAAVGEENVAVDITEYATAYAAGSKNQLYDYLSRGGGIILIGVVSGEKYMDITAYATAYAAHGKEAIAKASALPPENIISYKKFDGFDGEGTPILSPLFETEFKVVDIY